MATLTHALRSNKAELGRLAGRVPMTTVFAWIAGCAVVVLYLSSVSGHWYIGSDSALYMMLAENLAGGDGYTLWGRPHAHVPPGYPFMLATMMRLGLGGIHWLNLLMVVMSLLALWLGYRLVREQTSRLAAIAVAVVIAFSWEMHHISVQQLSDVPFMALVCGGLWCYTRGLRYGGWWLEVGTLALVGSCWVRVVGIPLAAAAGLGLLLQTRQVPGWRVWLNAVGILLGVALTASIFYWHHRLTQSGLPSASYAHHVKDLAHRPVLSWVWEPAGNLYETGGALARLLAGQRVSAAIALLVFWAPTAVGMFVHVSRRQYLGVVATAGYVGAILLLRPLIARYLLPVSPLLALYFLEGIRCLAGLPPRWVNAAERISVACALLLVAMNLPKDLRLVHQLHQSNFVELRKESWPALIETAEFLRQNAGLSDRFASSTSERTLGYLSRVPFLELAKSVSRQSVPAEAALATLDREAVRFLVLSSEPAPRYFEVLRGVIPQSAEFELAFDSGRFQVYRRVRQ